MIIFRGDYVLYRDAVYRVIDADGRMLIQLDTRVWIEATEKNIKGIRSEREMINFVRFCE
jgi:hypothetical protein